MKLGEDKLDMKSQTQVSVIIVNLNGKSLLEECLKSLMKVNYTNFEIILVDNNSTDQSVEFVKQTYPSVIIIKLDKNRGYAESNNIGAKNSKGEFLLFLNNDTVVTPNFITELVNVMNSDPKIVICQSFLLKSKDIVDSSGDFIDSIGVAYSSNEKITDIKEILSARGASMLAKKNVFEKLGGFDEQFYVSFEDVDLGWRAWIMGYKVVVVPKSIVYHLGGKTVNKMESLIAFHGIKNQLAMKITNFEFFNSIKSLILYFIIFGFKAVFIWTEYKLKGSTSIKTTRYTLKTATKPSFKRILKSVIWILKNRKYLARKRQIVNSNRIFSTKDLQKRKVILK